MRVNRPGRSGENLYQGRDLAVTTDFRAVIGAILAQHRRLNGRQLARVFADFRGQSPALAIV